MTIGLSGWVTAVVMVAAAGGAPLAAQDVAAGRAWIAAAEAGAGEAIAGLVIENPTMYDVYIVKAAAPEVAGAVEFRRTSAGGPAPVKEIAAPAYGGVELTADGVHLVLRDVKRPLRAGETVPIVLTTDGGATLRVVAEVRRE